MIPPRLDGLVAIVTGGAVARTVAVLPAESIAVEAHVAPEADVDSSYVTGQIVSADGGATSVNTVRPSGGAGAWSTEAVDRSIYGWA